MKITAPVVLEITERNTVKNFCIEVAKKAQTLHVGKIYCEKCGMYMIGSSLKDAPDWQRYCWNGAKVMACI